MRRFLTRLRVCLVAACASLTLAAPASAQVSAYVPTGDPSYRDLEALWAAGWVRGLIAGQRPYSRATFMRATAEARTTLEGEDLRRAHPNTWAPKPRLLEALARLEARFGPTHDGDGPAALRGAATEVSWALSPPRVIKSRYEGVPERIDADLDPLLQGNQGRVLANGSTAGAEAWGDLRFGSSLVVASRPRVWVAAQRGADQEAGVTLVHGYARALFGNLSVEVGRNTVTHGHARELDVALSDNARGLDMIRLSMERPARLPWVLQHLGPVSIAGTVADLGENRDNPGGVLVVWEGSIRPHPNLEVGMTLLNQQGGEGAPSASFGDRALDALFLIGRPFLSLPTDRQISDKMVGMDARLTLPGSGIDIYVEGLSTDDHNLFLNPRQAFWTEAAWTGGVRAVGLGASGRWDLWAEGGRNGVRPYTHHQFTSGLTLDRRILGSPLGPLATGVRGGVDWTGARDRISAGGAAERYSGDEYYRLYEGSMDWLKGSDNPDEVRLRATLDWIREPAATGLRTTVRLGWEHVTRFDFTDRSRANFLAQVGVGWGW